MGKEDVCLLNNKPVTDSWVSLQRKIERRNCVC